MPEGPGAGTSQGMNTFLERDCGQWAHILPRNYNRERDTTVGFAHLEWCQEVLDIDKARLQGLLEKDLGT